MKKTALLIALLLAFALVFASCSDNGDPEQTQDGAKATEKVPDETSSGKSPISTSSTDVVTEPVMTMRPEHEIDINDPKLTFVKEFPAPEFKTSDDLRQIVLDYMKKESEFEWTAAEDFTVTWKEKGDFGVNLDFKKGTKYTGIIYARTSGTYEQFEEYVNNGVFKSDTYYYEEVPGNNCSTSMVAAFNQLIDFYGSGGFKPNPKRYGILDFPIELQVPETSWYSADLHNLNGQDKIFEAYAALGPGDMLYKHIDGSGHTRMVDHVELSTNFSGEVNYARSQIVCIEQTNQFDKERPGINSTWYVGHKYGFSTLFQTGFMPVTLCIYHEENPVLKSAYITFNGNNTPESVLEALDGSVESNFVLNYVRLSLTDKSGNVVSFVQKNLLNQSYSYNIRKDHYPLFNGVPAGTYTFTLRAGIGRGACDIQQFEVTIK